MAIANEMRDRDESMVQKEREALAQKFEMKRRKGALAQQDGELTHMEKVVANQAAEIEEKTARLADLLSALEEARSDLSQREVEIADERSKRELEVAWKQEESAREEEEAKNVLERDMERFKLEDQRMEMPTIAKKFHEPEEAIHFDLERIISVPSHDLGQWNHNCGLIFDRKGIHLYSRRAGSAFTIPFGGVEGWQGGPYQGSKRWGATPRPEDESGQVTMFIKSKPDRPADCTMVVVSKKSTHNYLCVADGGASVN